MTTRNGLVGALGAILCVAGCGEPGAPAPADVLLLTIDTLRGDRWGCTGDPLARTPVVDRLARGGLLAFEGRAPAPVTLPSHATILTGVPPQVHGVRDNGTFRLAATSGVTLAEVLRGAGWQTGALISAFPLAARFGLERGFDHYDAFLANSGAGHLRERSAEVTVARTARWLRGPKAPEAGRPLFTWVHFFDPHAPYDPPAPFDRITPDPYRGEVAHVDREVGRLLELLQAERRRPLRLLIVSDHGESLGAHGELSHGLLVHLETMRVPIVVRDESWRPALRSEPVGLEHVAATVLELAGVQASLAAGAAGSVHRAPAAAVVVGETLYPWFNHGWRGLRVVERDGWRLIDGARPRLFRVAEDPGELADLAAERPRIVAELRAILAERWDERGGVAWDSAERTLSPEEAEALQALGYAGGGVESSIDAGFESGHDPADRLDENVRTNTAVALFDAGNPAAAVGLLNDVVREDPTNRMALEYLGRSRLTLGDAAGARDAIRRALALGPNPEAVWFDLADAERTLGNRAGEEEALRGALAASPGSGQARVQLATVLADRGLVDDALDLLEEAARIRPRAPTPHAAAARICESAGRTGDAVGHWKRVLALDPDDRVRDTARESIERLERREESGG